MNLSWTICLTSSLSEDILLIECSNRGFIL